MMDAVVVGAGFAGMYMVHKLRSSGFTVQGFEAGDDVGGTWYWNRYPGARCDVESMEYSYQFDTELQQEWTWSERYAPQPEILSYLNHVADRFDLRQNFRFETRVLGARYDESQDRWHVATDDGQETTARFLIMATGCLSSTNTPDIAGLDSFAGDVLHTGRWPHDGVDLANKRVGIIGTGSSGVQAIPELAEQSGHLTVFQRTPQYTIPARNRLLDETEIEDVKADYPAFRAGNNAMPGAYGFPYVADDRFSAFDFTPEQQHEELERRWQVGGTTFMWAFSDAIIDPAANEVVAEFVRGKIGEIVHDPETASLLSPQHVIGCKRIVVDTNYFDTFNRDNVSLVDVGTTPITEITAAGVRVGDTVHDIDTLVFATGFDAMTGTVMRMDLQGRNGQRIQDSWAAGPRTYLGLAVPDFPNMFTISGPGSPSVLTNMVASIEQHVEWITDCIVHMNDQGCTSIEATEDASDNWVLHVNSVADKTLYPTCNSWYLGANVPGKTRVFMPLLGFPPYVERCNAVAAAGYQGFELSTV
jgi:cation diffusion facilitator CzcD-associated flavoprotein CzcO